jgi:hypothetical protein
MVQDFNSCSHMPGCFKCPGRKPFFLASCGNSLPLPALADRVRRSSHEVDWGSLGLVGDPIVNSVRPAVDKAATAQLFQIVLHGAPTGGMSAATLATRAVLSETSTVRKSMTRQKYGIRRLTKDLSISLKSSRLEKDGAKKNRSRLGVKDRMLRCSRAISVAWPSVQKE